MDRVLTAERKAREQIEACHAEADGILRDARDREQHILEQARRRVQHVHEICQRATAERIRAMRRESAEKMSAIDYRPGRSQAVASAAVALAERLTKPTHDRE